MKDEHKTKAQLIEELKQVRIALKESETKRTCAEEEPPEGDEQFRLLAESLPDLVYEFDPEGKFMYVNEAATHLFGYSQDEMLNDIRVHDTVVEEDRVPLRKAIHDVLNGKTAVGERTLIRKDGSTFIGEIHSGPIYKGNDVVGVRGILRDITERKRLEEALHKSEKRFRDQVNLLPEAVYEIDLEGKFTFANTRAFQLIGYSQEDFAKGMDIVQLFIPEDRGRAKENISRIMDGGDLGFIEYTMQRKDGSTFPIMAHSAPIIYETKIVGLREIAIDISRFKEAERKIRTLSSAVEQSIDGIALGDLEPKLLYVNEAFARMHGYSAEEMINMKVVHLHNEEQMDQYKKAIHQIKTKGSWTGEIEHIRKDGIPFPTYMSITLLKDHNGKPTGILAIARDITEQKRAEEELRESEERFRLAVEATMDGLWENRRDHKKDFFSDRMFTMIGYEPVAPAKGFDFFYELLHPDDVQSFKEKYHAMDKPDHDDYSVESRLKAKDGTWRHIISRGKCVERDEKGNPVRIIGTHTDITDLKRAEESLRASEERFALAVRGSNDGIWDWDMQNNTLYWSPRMKDLLGYADDEIDVNYDTFESHLHPEDRDRTLTILEAHLRDRAQYNVEHRLRTKSGDYRWFHTRGLAIWDEAGNPIRIAGSSTDINERKRAEEEILTYQHKLRSLASELSLTEERERRRVATELHDSVGHALALGKIKLGALRESLSSTSEVGQLDEISELFEEAIQSVRSLTFELSPPLLHELGLEAALEWLAERVQLQYGIPIIVEDDRQPKPMDEDVQILLFQATRELLVNVIKHAQARNARVSIHREYDDIELNVEDDGVGFDASEIVSSTNSTGGLGFFNIRERLNHIQGHLEIQSEPGNGTRVTIVVPLKTESEIANRGPA